MKKKISLIVSAGTLFLVCVAFCLLSSRFWGQKSWDVTSDRRYTLKTESVQLVKSLQKPLYFRLYISDNWGKYDMEKARYADYVIGILQRYAAKNPQMAKLEIRRFAPYSQTEQNAVREGIAAETDAEETFYLGLSVRDENGNGETIARLLPQRRRALEDDINRIIYRSLYPEKPVIGITSADLPMFGAPVKGRVWSIMPRLEAEYRVAEISEKSLVIPEQIDLLIVQNPSYLPELYLYALDQYLMRGGKIILLPDPFSEAESFYRGFPPSGKNNIEALLKSYGILFNGQQAVGDLERAAKIEIEEDGISRMVAYPFWFFAENADFSYLHFRTPGALQTQRTEGVTYYPLVYTSAKAGSLPVSELRYMPRQQIIEQFSPQAQKFLLAVLAEGDFVSHYREGALSDTVYANYQQPYLPLSLKKGQLAVIADSDFIADDAWVYAEDRKNPLYGTVNYASNAEFFINLINRMLGNRDILKYGNDFGGKNEAIASALFVKVAEGYAPELEKIMQPVENNVAAPLAGNGESYGEKLLQRSQKEVRQQQTEEKNARLRRYAYLIKSQTEAKLNFFMLSNLILYPAGIILLLYAVAFVLRKYKNRWMRK